MAGSTTTKTVQVVVAGDSSGAQTALNELSDKSASAASTIKSKLSGLFNTLNASGLFGGITGQLAEVVQSFDGLEVKAKDLAGSFSNIGIATAGVGAGLTIVSQGGKNAEASLSNAFKNAGSNMDDYKGKIDDTVSSMAKYGYTSVQTDAALQVLVQGTKNPTESINDMGVAADLAAAKHESLTAAANQLLKVLEGKGTRTLQQFGITQSATAVTAQSLSSAENKLSSASAATQTAISSVDSKIASLGAAHKATNQQVEATISAYNNMVKVEESGTATSAQIKSAQDAYNSSLSAMVGPAGMTVSQQLGLQDATGKVSAAFQKQHTAQQTVTTDQKAMSDAASQGKTSVTALAGAIKNDASVQADTWTGKLKALRAEIENNIDDIGQKYGPAITALGSTMTIAGTAAKGLQSILGLFKSSTEAATTAEEALTVAEGEQAAATDAVAASETAADIAGAPLILTIGLIVAAVAVLAAGIYELVTHWSAVWSAIKTATSAFVSWLDGVWNTIYGYLRAPLDDFIGWLTTFWDDVVGFFEKIPGAIESAIGSLVGVGEKIVMDIYNGINDSFAGTVLRFYIGTYTRIFDAIGSLIGIGENIVVDIYRGVTAAWGDISGFFVGTYSRVLSYVGSLVGVGETIIVDIARGIDADASAVSGIFVGFYSWILRAVGNVTGVGDSIIHDISNGIGSGTSWIWSFFSGIVGWIASAVSNAAYVGEKLIYDISQGIWNGAGDIYDAFKGVFSRIPGIGGALSAIGLAEGGIVTKPTLAMVGEAGYPEAVIPLKNGEAVKGINDGVLPLPVGATQATNTHGGSATTGNGSTYNVTQNISLPQGTPQQFAQETTWQLSRLVA